MAVVSTARQQLSSLMMRRTMYPPDTALGRGSHRWSINQVAQQGQLFAPFLWSLGGALSRGDPEVNIGEEW